MRSCWILAGILLASFGVGLLAFQQEQIRTAEHASASIDQKKSPIGPQISFDELVFDFKAAGQQQEIRHEFVFRNSGDKPLIVQQIESDCGGTAVVLPSEQIAPGAEGILQVVLKTRRYEGKQEKKIHVYSNDPAQPKVELLVTGVVTTQMAVVPAGLAFGNVVKGETSSRELKVYQVEPEPLIINRVEANPRHFDIVTSRFDEDNGRGFLIRATLLTQNAEVGPFTEAITLHTNAKGRARVDIPACANILGRIQADPRTVHFGVLKKGRDATVEVRLRRRDVKEFQLVRTETDISHLDLKVTELTGRKEYVIAAHLQKNCPTGRMFGEIRVFTDDPEESLIRLPCSVSIEE